MASNFLKIYKGTTYAPQTSAPSNPIDGDVYYDSTLNKFRGYQNGSWQDLITDGSDGITYILNPGAEAGADGYVAYVDAAATSPVDGIGGSPSFITWVRTTTASEILRKDASFRLAKSSGNAQGEGVAYDFTIDPRDKNNKIQISFDYKNLDSNYVNGDLKIFVYDIDNSILIGNVINDDDGDVLIAPADGGSFYGEIQATDSSNYRLIFHVAGTTSADWALSVDSIKAGPTSGQLFSVMSDWETFTPTGTWTTNTLYTGRYRRVGDSMEVNIVMQFTGAPNAADLTINMPSGFTVDTSKLALSTIANIIGNVKYDDNSLAAAQGVVVLTSPTTVRPLLERITGNNDIIVPTQTLPHTWAINDSIAITFRVPIVGWHSTNLVSNNQLNQQTMRVVAEHSGGTNFSNGVSTKIIYDIENLDNMNTYDPVTGIWTCPATGWYELHAQTGFNALTPGTGDVQIFFADSSLSSFYGFTRTPIENTIQSFEVKRDLFFTKGDEVITAINQTNGAGRSTSVQSNFHQWSIKRITDFTSYGVLNPKTEYLEAVATTTSTVSSDTEIDVTGLSLDLTPGTWEIGYNLSTRVINNDGSPNTVFGRTRITDDSNIYVPDTSMFFGGTNVNAVASIYSSTSIKREITVTENKTYKVRLTCNDAVANGDASVFNGSITGQISDDDASSIMWARRIK